MNRRTLSLMMAAGLASPAAFGQRAAPKPPPSPQFAALAEIANALGMLRGTQREWKSINRIYYIADGSVSVPGTGERWTDYKLTRGMIEMNYVMPALRVDVTRSAGGKTERSIEVARGDAAWNETGPGIGATNAPGAAKGRRWLIYTTPHGVVRAAMEAAVKDAASVAVDAKGFKFPSPDGVATVALDANKRPSRVELAVNHPVLGATTVVTALSDYRDWEKLGVWFPARIVQTIGARKTQDLRVTEFRSNPYVIFPIPAGVG
ncbi:MAG TPA: hypothetical protein VJQ51_00110 [Burkholderiales bacterium]|nr:hypothetical protein [Burkholderiales bacterium]